MMMMMMTATTMTPGILRGPETVMVQLETRTDRAAAEVRGGGDAAVADDDVDRGDGDDADDGDGDDDDDDVDDDNGHECAGSQDCRMLAIRSR